MLTRPLFFQNSKSVFSWTGWRTSCLMPSRDTELYRRWGSPLLPLFCMWVWEGVKCEPTWLPGTWSISTVLLWCSFLPLFLPYQSSVTPLYGSAVIWLCQKVAEHILWVGPVTEIKVLMNQKPKLKLLHVFWLSHFTLERLYWGAD